MSLSVLNRDAEVLGSHRSALRAIIAAARGLQIVLRTNLGSAAHRRAAAASTFLSSSSAAAAAAALDHPRSRRFYFGSVGDVRLIW
ncbi:hypothetical protein ACP70R_040908 [Stipagrostis hirtigluma subsp. patula]